VLVIVELTLLELEPVLVYVDDEVDEDEPVLV
jgi:hypothetical protein